MSNRILLVDDEPDTLDLFRQCLRRELRGGEFALDYVDSGELALARLGEQMPAGVSVVLCDINMPGMTGFEVLAEVRQRWADLAVIMVTAYGDTATQQRAASAGASGFVCKPVDFAVLKALLRSQVADGNA